MKRTLKTVFSAVLTVVLGASLGCAPTQQTIKTPVVEVPSTVVSNSSNQEVGLTAGFPLPHYDGQMGGVYDYDDDYYYYNNNRVNGADPGAMYTSEADLKYSYEKLIAKEKQFIAGAGALVDSDDYSSWEDFLTAESEAVAVVAEKYGTWDEWKEKYVDQFYMVVTNDHGTGLSPETKQKYTEAAYGAYELRASKDLANWKLVGPLDGGRCVIIRHDDFANGFFWAPEINKDPISGLYMISGNTRTKNGNAGTDYNPTTTLPATSEPKYADSVDAAKWDGLTPIIAISPTPTGPYHIVTSDEYYSHVAQYNADGTLYTVEKDGKVWSVYRKDIKWEEGNDNGGYVLLTEVKDGEILNQNGIQIKPNNSMLSIGYYSEAIKRALPHWTLENRGIFPAIDTHMFIESTGKLYLYFNSHSSTASTGNQIWCLPMKDICSPDWDNFTPVTKASYSTLYYDGETQGDFAEMPLYRQMYIDHLGFTGTKYDAAFGVPGYYMDEGYEKTVNEATNVIEKDGYYYLTYSPLGYHNKNYSAYFAISDNPFGPFIKVQDYCPALGVDKSEIADYMGGTGHHSIVSVGDDYWILYHYFYNPNNNFDASGNFLGRCVGADRLNFYDYDGVKFSELKQEQIDKDVAEGLDRAWIEDCFATGNHRNHANAGNDQLSDIIKIPYGNGPTYSLQPNPETATGYDNVAKTATVTMLEGDTATEKYANDGMVTYQKWTDKYEVVGNSETRQLKLKLSWETPQTIRNIMIYNSRSFVYAFDNVRSIVFKLADKPSWYTQTEYNGYCYIENLKPDSQCFDLKNRVMRKGGSAIANFFEREISVTEIIITIDATDKIATDFNSTNRYVVKLSEIYIMGNPTNAQ